MGAGIVAPGHEAAAGRSDVLQGFGDGIGFAHTRGIGPRAHDDEIVVHELAPVDTVTVRDEALLSGARVHHDHVHIAGTGDAQRLTGTHGDDVHRHAAVLLEHGQQITQQAGILGAGGGGQAQGLGGIDAARAGEQNCHRRHEAPQHNR